MSTATKERSDALEIARVVDDLDEVRDKLAAVEAACRAADGPEATAGLARIVMELEGKVAESVETVEVVLERLREREEAS